MWDKLIHGVNRFVGQVCATFLVVMVVLIFVQILMRELVASSFPWTEEVSRYLMVWITLLGAGLAFQHGAHIGIEALVHRLPSPAAKVARGVAALACAAFFLVMIVQGLDILDNAMQQRSPALRIPMGYVYLAVPISGLYMLLNLIDVTVKEWRRDRGVTDR